MATHKRKKLSSAQKAKKGGLGPNSAADLGGAIIIGTVIEEVAHIEGTNLLKNSDPVSAIALKNSKARN